MIVNRFDIIDRVKAWLHDNLPVEKTPESITDGLLLPLLKQYGIETSEDDPSRSPVGEVRVGKPGWDAYGSDKPLVVRWTDLPDEQYPWIILNSEGPQYMSHNEMVDRPVYTTILPVTEAAIQGPPVATEFRVDYIVSDAGDVDINWTEPQVIVHNGEDVEQTWYDDGGSLPSAVSIEYNDGSAYGISIPSPLNYDEYAKVVQEVSQAAADSGEFARGENITVDPYRYFQRGVVTYRLLGDQVESERYDGSEWYPSVDYPTAEALLADPRVKEIERK